MSDPQPPALPRRSSASKSPPSLKVTGLIIFALVLVILPIALRLLGLIRPFSIPTSAMAPAVSAGDHIFAEGITYLARKPRRGDIAVFRSDGISKLAPSIYVKRIIGEPGDRVELVDGSLFINGAKTTLSNAYGEIRFQLPPMHSLLATTNIIVPEKSYFVMGDNSTNSFDSRFFGVVPAKNIIGRVSVCYWPLTRVGSVQ